MVPLWGVEFKKVKVIKGRSEKSSFTTRFWRRIVTGVEVWKVHTAMDTIDKREMREESWCSIHKTVIFYKGYKCYEVYPCQMAGPGMV